MTPRRPRRRPGGAAYVVPTLLALAACSGPPDAEARALAFTELLAAERYIDAAELFDPTLTRTLPPEQLSAIWSALPSRHGRYLGHRSVETTPTLAATRVHLVVELERAFVDLMVVVRRDGRIGGLWLRPDGVAKPSDATSQTPVGVRELEVLLPTAPVPLPATVALPLGDGQKPTVIFLHDAGAGDRDGAVGSDRPQRELARALAALGVASVRFDKRSRVQPESQASVATEVADGAAVLAAVGMAAPELDTEQLWILGVGIGGYLAPRVAEAALARGVKPAGIVLAGAPARPLPEVVLAKLTAELSRDGVSAAEEVELATLTAQAEQIRIGQVSERRVLLGVPGTFWSELAGYDPAALLARLGLPTLALRGELDPICTAADHDRWQEALRSIPAEVRLVTQPGQEHLLRAAPAAEAISTFIWATSRKASD